MYDFLSENIFLSPNYSEFTSEDFCINQLLSINHEILNASDKGLKLPSKYFNVFLTLSFG